MTATSEGDGHAGHHQPDDRGGLMDLDALERPFLEAVRDALVRGGIRQQDLANSMAGYGLVIHDTGVSKALALTGPRRALRLAEVLAIASILDLDLNAFVPKPEA